MIMKGDPTFFGRFDASFLDSLTFCFRNQDVAIEIDRTNFKELERTPQPNPGDSKQLRPVRSILQTASKATVAVALKYFQVVDLLMNFFGKVNIEIGESLQNQVEFLNNAEFPKIGFIEAMSMSNDGGQDEVDLYLNRTLTER